MRPEPHRPQVSGVNVPRHPPHPPPGRAPPTDPFVTGFPRARWSSTPHALQPLHHWWIGVSWRHPRPIIIDTNNLPTLFLPGGPSTLDVKGAVDMFMYSTYRHMKWHNRTATA